MGEVTNSFVKYLNALHEYNGQNQNAFAEKNVKSPYYTKTVVEMPVCEYIVKALSENEPCILVLTGHAGDGKTSIMYQVLSQMNIVPDFDKQVLEITLSSGKQCCCIKDFSELSENKQLDTMKQVVEYHKEGKHVFMVANTGPLINTFGKLFDNNSDSESAKMQLINAMSENKGKVTHIFSYSFLVINIAAIDNTTFPTKYLSNIINDSLWNVCEACDKKEYCHIFNNYRLIKSNRDHVFDFLSKYYIWETEYGHRLTVRDMTGHLAYMITGGIECEDVPPIDLHKMLFPNLFFGYVGTIQNHQASNLKAIRMAQDNHFEQKRLRADEDLLIRRSFKSLFSQGVANILYQAEKDRNKFLPGLSEELRRFYFFLNIVPDEVWRRDIEDIFSKQYALFLDVRNGTCKPNKTQKSLIIDALKMMYQGTAIGNSQTIPITLSKESGIVQSVQLVVGTLNESDLEIIAADNSLMNSQKKDLILRARGKKITVLSLPMMNYFEELRSGIISTNIDPQLSHGIENLKAQLMEAVVSNDDELDMIVLNNTGFEKKSIIIENGAISLI